MYRIARFTVSIPWDGRRSLVMRWVASSFSGWGVYGLNLALALARSPAFVLFAGERFAMSDIVLDPLRTISVSELARRSAPLWDLLDRAGSADVFIDAPTLLPMSHDLRSAGDGDTESVTDQPSIGVVFMEHATLDAAARARGNRLPLIVAGSSWNASVLRAQGVERVATVFQGVDTGQFHPAPRAGLFPGRFIVFSGGKLEYRKGQDMVLAAFRVFRQRHPEALLLTAWHSPWGELSATASGLSGITQPTRGAGGAPDAVAWAVANGIPADAAIDLGPVPNIAMPHVLREADVAIFTNRAEGGTNLVAMECMACGIPTILSANTGHLDLLAGDGVAAPLRRQTQPVRDGVDTADWGESDVEEAVEALEKVWRDRTEAAAMGARGARFMAGLCWRTQVDALLRAIEPVL